MKQNLTCYNLDYNRQPPRRYFAPLRHVGSPVGWAIWVQTHRRAYPRRAHRDGVCLIRQVESRRRGETCSGGSGEWAQPGWYVLRRLQGVGVVQPRRKRLGAIVWQVLSFGLDVHFRHCHRKFLETISGQTVAYFQGNFQEITQISRKCPGISWKFPSYTL